MKQSRDARGGGGGSGDGGCGNTGKDDFGKQRRRCAKIMLSTKSSASRPTMLLPCDSFNAFDVAVDLQYLISSAPTQNDDTAEKISYLAYSLFKPTTYVSSFTVHAYKVFFRGDGDTDHHCPQMKQSVR
ncbi:unnamed protein product [Taenia asiatica]|uniref:Beta-lactamase domain-containing protein n=1 Tax=Taenia asiatica TaxID=60517 RepID=A0A0R3VY22_TAEAS|nr:unnamed protein product [Taenia asiatica]